MTEARNARISRRNMRKSHSRMNEGGIFVFSISKERKMLERNRTSTQLMLVDMGGGVKENSYLCSLLLTF